MAFKLADRVRESNVISGTGAVTLGGSVTNYQTFASQMSNGDTTWYALIDSVGGAWEVGVGTWNTSNTLSRTTVLASSNSGSLVSFAGNACDCFMDLPASTIANAPQALIVAGVTANASLGTMPANGFVLWLFFRETAGHAVTVGIGSTSGATDVLSPVTVPASGALLVPIANFSNGWFSASATQGLFLTSASWGSASLNASLTYQRGV